MAYSQIQWTWTIGTGGSVTGFFVKCGHSSGNYSVITTVNDPNARTLSVYTGTNAQRGVWFATVEAFNLSGSSGDGPEITFTLPFFSEDSSRFGLGG
jgi:hypothetical protein